MLQGRQVGLRERRRADLEPLARAHGSDAEHMALTDARPFQPRSLESWLAEWDKAQTEPVDPRASSFAVQRLDDEQGAAIGGVSLWSIDHFNRSAHIGISLLPSARGQGLGRDALEVICRYGFEILNLARLQLETLDVNAPMQATARSCGFVEEGRLRQSAWYLGRRADDVIFGLLADEWHARTP